MVVVTIQKEKMTHVMHVGIMEFFSLNQNDDYCCCRRRRIVDTLGGCRHMESIRMEFFHKKITRKIKLHS